VIGYDVSEELDIKPAEYFVRVTKREKRACPQCEEGGVMAAPLPAKIVEKGKLSNAVVVDVILKKYRDHTPLYRQGMILDRDCEIEISRSTLCNGVMTSGYWLEMIRKELIADLLAGNYIQADETPIGVQTPEKTGSNHRGYLWQYGRPGGPVVFDFQMGRGREGPRKFLGNFNGKLQSDGYSAVRQDRRRRNRIRGLHDAREAGVYRGIEDQPQRKPLHGDRGSDRRTLCRGGACAGRGYERG
jgi:transposase